MILAEMWRCGDVGGWKGGELYIGGSCSGSGMELRWSYNNRFSATFFFSISVRLCHCYELHLPLSRLRMKNVRSLCPERQNKSTTHSMYNHYLSAVS